MAKNSILAKKATHILILCAVLLSACGGGGSSDGSSSGGSSNDEIISFSSIPINQLKEASLFLNRAGFGGALDEIEEVAVAGKAGWLSNQLSMTPSHHTNQAVQNYRDYCAEVPSPGCGFEGAVSGSSFRQFVLWDRVLNAPDQVHQKVAYALSQIFVISELMDKIGSISSTTYWWDLLLTYGLTNYRDLLEAVTLSPTMGVYLSHYNNSKGDPQNGIFPDENYAREVMQLFSIGLYELNADGSRIKDSDGNDIPTYSNLDIREFAKVFTGLGNGCGAQWHFEGRPPTSFNCPMRMYENYHAAGSKTLLKGQVIPDGQTGMQDVRDAVNNLYNHPNVGPFIGRLLIQRLVKSNPTPQYIERVSNAFNDNGNGVRGDMKAVVSAILLDPEASERNESSGKVRDPFTRFAHIYRALKLNSKTGQYYLLNHFIARQMKQFPLNSPSVFNFYSPEHIPFGEAGDLGLFSPELQIITASSALPYYNIVRLNMHSSTVFAVDELGEVLTLNFSDLYAYKNSPATVIEYIDVLFTHGAMSNITRQAIKDVFIAVSTEPEFAVRLAVFYATVSPEYIVRP